jgi:ABC-type bacteriocin/lantibiotic exporter with double-glycine peptidase domain
MIPNIFTPVYRFRQLLKVDRKDISQVYTYALFNGLVNLSLPLGIQAIINLIQGGELTTSWIVLVAFVIGGVALTGFLQLMQLRIVENIAQKIFSRASFEFAYRLPKIKHGSLYNYYAPELANRFFDTMTIQKGLPKILIDFSLALFQIVVGLLLLSLYHSFFIIFSLVLVGLIYIILAYTGPMGLKTSLIESKQKYKIAFWLEEIARTKLSFKLISNSDLAMEKTNDEVKAYVEAREDHFKVLISQFSYLIGFKVVIAAGLLITGSILVFNQEMNIGQFVAAEIIIILILASVEKLIKSLDSIYDVLTALEKIGYVLDMPMDAEGGFELESAEDSISTSVEGLSFSFPDSPTPIIKDVSIHIPGDQSVVITGSSGSGKSTLIQIVSGILKPDTGVVKYNGMPFGSIDQNSLRRQVGFALSSSDIFHGSIYDNIKMGRIHVNNNDISKVLEISNLTSFVQALPQGLQTILDPEGKKVPRSIQNKIVLARAIVGTPSLVIMEDPLSHISREEKEEIIKRITNHNNPWKIIVASIDPTWLSYIKHEISLENGIIVLNTFNRKGDA